MLGVLPAAFGCLGRPRVLDVGRGELAPSPCRSFTDLRHRVGKEACGGSADGLLGSAALCPSGTAASAEGPR